MQERLTQQLREGSAEREVLVKRLKAAERGRKEAEQKMAAAKVCFAEFIFFLSFWYSWR
jgi:hypothetical protein